MYAYLYGYIIFISIIIVLNSQWINYKTTSILYYSLIYAATLVPLINDGEFGELESERDRWWWWRPYYILLSIHPYIHSNSTLQWYFLCIHFTFSSIPAVSCAFMCFSLFRSFTVFQASRKRELTQPQPVYFSFLLLLKVYFSSLYLSLTLLYVIFLSLNQATNKEYTSAISTLYKPYGCFSV